MPEPELLVAAVRPRADRSRGEAGHLTHLLQGSGHPLFGVSIGRSRSS
ncbi:MAG: hypothetical protein AAF327_06480 [Cyanobacteria bacterium P01_A01_bin.37]